MQTTLMQRVAPWLWLIAGLLAAWGVAVAIPHTLAIFVVASLIACGIAPPTYRLTRWMPLPVALLLVYTALLAALVILVLIVVPAAIAQAQASVTALSAHAGDLHGIFEQMQRSLAQRFGQSYTGGIGQLQTMLGTRVEGATTAALTGLAGVILGTVTVLVILVSALVLSAFFVAQGQTMSEHFRDLFPLRQRHLAESFSQEIAQAFGGFVLGQTVLCALTGILVWAALMLLHVPFAVLAGVASGFGYAVPFVGLLVVQVGVALLALPLGWSVVLQVSIAIFVIARVIDTLVAPKVFSDSVGVSPIMVMFAVFAGGELCGPVGVVLGIPAAALAKAIWRIVRQASADRALIVPDSTSSSLPDDCLTPKTSSSSVILPTS